MKLFKHTLITACAFVGIASSVLYTACEKDACTDLQCKNGGSCADGYCRCPSGYEGASCETRIVDRFIGSYIGTTRCNELPPLTDTLDVFFSQAPTTVGMVYRSKPTDTTYGTCSDKQIVVPAKEGNNQKRTYNIVLSDTKKLTYWDQNIYDVKGKKQNVCTFVGIRP